MISEHRGRSGLRQAPQAPSCCLIQSRRAWSIRVCHPRPPARKWSMTPWDNRMVVDTFGRAFGGRPRRTGALANFSGQPSFERSGAVSGSKPRADRLRMARIKAGSRLTTYGTARSAFPAVEPFLTAPGADSGRIAIIWRETPGHRNGFSRPCTTTPPDRRGRPGTSQFPPSSGPCNGGCKTSNPPLNEVLLFSLVDRHWMLRHDN